MRPHHHLRDKVVHFPTHGDEDNVWHTLLDIPAGPTTNKRVLLGHFHREDIMLNVCGRLALIKKKVEDNVLTCYQYTKYNIKNNMNPVPSSSKEEIRKVNNLFYFSLNAETVKRSRKDYSFADCSKEELYRVHKTSNFYQLKPQQVLETIETSVLLTRHKPLSTKPYLSFMGTAHAAKFRERKSQTW